jgi:methylthioribose-1-phosphate isomerase
MKTPNLPQPIEWSGDRARIIDQTRLPLEEAYLDITDYRDMAAAIRELKIRGAPSIGVAGAYGMALGGLAIRARTKQAFLKKLDTVCRELAATRPTARDLFWAIERMQKSAQFANTIAEIKSQLVANAIAIHKTQVDYSLRLSRHGARLMKDGWRVLTICNTGPLAAPGYGTALGVIICARERRKDVSVYACETRPLLQGARLTTWECQKAGVPVTLITDGMAGWLMKQGKIDCVIVGADRIAANGDTANKIGTYTLAVLAKENGIPFYVAAPTSAIDLSLKTGDEIPIEERKPEEVTHFAGVRTAVSNVVAVNPAFDVTPHEYITAIVTEKGIIQRPFKKAL